MFLYKVENSFSTCHKLNETMLVSGEDFLSCIKLSSFLAPVKPDKNVERKFVPWPLRAGFNALYIMHHGWCKTTVLGECAKVYMPHFSCSWELGCIKTW